VIRNPCLAPIGHEHSNRHIGLIFGIVPYVQPLRCQLGHAQQVVRPHEPQRHALDLRAAADLPRTLSSALLPSHPTFKAILF
jgi:hypothetical protein